MKWDCGHVNANNNIIKKQNKESKKLKFSEYCKVRWCHLSCCFYLIYCFQIGGVFVFMGCLPVLTISNIYLLPTSKGGGTEI